MGVAHVLSCGGMSRHFHHACISASTRTRWPLVAFGKDRTRPVFAIAVVGKCFLFFFFFLQSEDRLNPNWRHIRKEITQIRSQQMWSMLYSV